MKAGQGRTHRYFTGKPLYPFAYGLGYSTFTYTNATLSHTSLSAGLIDINTVVTVFVAVTNNGEFTAAPSEEVVTVFALPTLDKEEGTEEEKKEEEQEEEGKEEEGMSVPRQVLWGFTKVSIPPHTTVNVKVR